jgi:hypothetical protein
MSDLSDQLEFLGTLLTEKQTGNLDYRKYKKKTESEIFRMFKAELPEIYESLKRECAKKNRRERIMREEAMLQND